MKSLIFLKSIIIDAVIPSKKNRVNTRYHDEHLDRRRHLIENTFLKLKALARHCHSLCQDNLRFLWRRLACFYFYLAELSFLILRLHPLNTLKANFHEFFYYFSSFQNRHLLAVACLHNDFCNCSTDYGFLTFVRNK